MGVMSDIGKSAGAGRLSGIIVPLMASICAGMAAISLLTVPAIIPIGAIAILAGVLVGIAAGRSRA